MEVTNNGIIKDAREVFGGGTGAFHQFGHWAEQYLDLKSQRDKIDQEIESLGLRDKLTRAMAEVDVAKVIHGHHQFNIITKVNKKLDRVRLLENGVSASVIDASTITSESSYLEVRERKVTHAT